MKKATLTMITALLVALICIVSCTHKPQVSVTPADGNFPAAVSAIFLAKCATAGCHDQASYKNSAGLLLDSWAHLFQGDVNGAEVVAYSTKFSTLLYYVNTDSALGVVATDPGHLPTPLSHTEYMTLYNWIAAGAPDKNGNIPFATNAATRQKLYLTNQGCDVVSVIDGQSKLVMRYIAVGDANNAAPHSVAISGDGAYAYVPFYNGSEAEKIDTRTDTVVSSVNLGAVAAGGTGGAWSIAMLSPLDTAFMVSGWTTPGYAVMVNTANMTIDAKSSVDVISGGTNLFAYPHGLANNVAFDTFYAVLNYGNTVNKFWFAPSFGYKYISLDGNSPVTSSSATTPNPHQIMMSPDHSRYFVSCQNTNDVRVVNTSNDSVIAVIPVGTFPQEMEISTSKNQLFVACMQDAANPNNGYLGSVYVIDLSSLAVVTRIYGDFYQPHDVAVDEQDGLLYIPSRNVSTVGPPPHHATACSGGRPAWYSVYNLSSLTPADNIQYVVPSDPYVISPRFR